VKALALAVGLALALAACAPTTTSGPTAPPAVAPAPEPPKPVAASVLPDAVVQAQGIKCAGHAVQGGYMVCETAPFATVIVDDKATTTADEHGLAVIGFDRDAPASAKVDVRAKTLAVTLTVPVAPREFRVQNINGLPSNTVEPTEPALLERIAREVKVKNVGFGSRSNGEQFTENFVWPVDGIVSSPWGNQRILNGVRGAPHYGVDIAAPEGAPIRAPAGGVVALAEPDMHFEGGLVMIDHGQGLISLYLHMSRVDVKPGDIVKQGDLIGAVGKKGRATGPHLCWRMKWRDRNIDPSLLPVNALKPYVAAQK
jgi:murein DD-endopeptidase MepM/ murein hydrolase activator NlpD